MEQASGRKLIGNTALYAVADIFGKGLHFILLPLYTMFLSTEDYGIQNIVIGFNSVMNYIVLLCLDSAALRFYAKYSNDREKLREFYGTALLIVLMFASAVTVACVACRGLIGRYVMKDVPFVPYVVLGLGIMVFDAFYTLHRRFMEAEQKGKKVTLVSIVTAAVSSAATLILIGVFKLGATGLLAATLFVSFGTFIFAVCDITRNRMVKFCFRKDLAKSMLAYSLPLIPHQVSGYLAALISKIFLNESGSLSAVGLYGVATQFSSVVDVVQDASSRAYRPWLFQSLGSQNGPDPHRIRTMSNVLMSGYTVVTVGMGLFAQEIIWLMTSQSFHGAWKVIPFLSVAVSVKSLYMFYIAHCLYYPKTAKFVFVASITANLCNIFLSALLVPAIGMFGSAAALFCSYTVNTTIIIALNRKNGDIGYSLQSMLFRLIFSWLVIVVGTVPGYLLWPDRLSFPSIAIKLAVFMAYLFFLWRTNNDEIAALVGTDRPLEVIRRLWRGRK